MDADLCRLTYPNSFTAQHCQYTGSCDQTLSPVSVVIVTSQCGYGSGKVTILSSETPSGSCMSKSKKIYTENHAEAMYSNDPAVL